MRRPVVHTVVHTWFWRCRVLAPSEDRRFLVRRRVPKDLLSIVGRREEKASLGTKDVGEAKRRFAEHAAMIERRWESLRAGVQRMKHP